MEHYDAIVVGAGVMGSATAYQLAKRGRRVLLLEQFAIGHERGSSHGRSRIIRLAYDAPEYVRLARAAYPLWRLFEREAGAALLLQTGGLDLARPGQPSFEATRASLTASGVPFDLLDRAAIAERFPQFQPPEDTIAIYQADAGILDADRCVAALASEARRYGATIREEELARRLAPSGDGVEVRTDRQSYGAERLVVTAGSWARPLLRQLGLDLPLSVSKEQIAYFEPRDPALFEPHRFPIFIHHTDSGWHYYGFPIFGLPGVKVAQHHGGPVIDPESDDYAVIPARLDAVRAYVSQMLPQAAGAPIFTQTCRYTRTPDDHFIIDHHPAHPQILVGSPCSGHGFKFGVLIGKILADLVEEGATDQPIGMFSLGRFDLRSRNGQSAFPLYQSGAADAGPLGDST
jgi:monomeric sarcosine oxidase